jgi:hypothetical protein
MKVATVGPGLCAEGMPLVVAVPDRRIVGDVAVVAALPARPLEGLTSR